MFKKILIANRGEIAIRVMRACREMGIRSVAVYSDSDRLAFHVMYADESRHIGPSPSIESYLCIDRIIDAARRSGADAIHPGYGFLAENADFAEACASAGIVFIGPPPNSIRRMGNKLEARKAMAGSGVPTIPGSDTAVPDASTATRIARTIGFPVMLKAAAGGGGKGMRLVENAKHMSNAIDVTVGEARSAFGDASVFVEKWIERPKHIEVQILADTHGNTIAVGERECSMQRRYQKVIEEAPSPSVTPPLRAALCSAAVTAARAVNYVGAGTVEFIMSPGHDFYFLEMNTRLQVEHPVTEMVYGVDLVNEQIRIAAGEAVSDRAKSAGIRGHAIECRIYAEDPHTNFMPSTGRIKQLVLPQGPGVRNENGVYPGYEVPIYYDPLMGKLIAWGEDRPTAIRRARRALEEYQIDGVSTNIEFLLWALTEPGFNDGSYDTHYVEQHFLPGVLHTDDNEIELAIIAAAITAHNCAQRTNAVAASDTRETIWRRVARMEALRKPRM